MDKHESQQYDEWLYESDDGEEFYDALNDETFGNIDDQCQFSWDDLQALPPLPHPNIPNKTESNDSSRVTSNLDCTKKMPLSEHHEVDCLREDHNYPFASTLEKNILKLVMDDDEEFEEGDIDEEEESSTKNIKQRYSIDSAGSKSGYLIPPQVSARHTHWLSNKVELEGATGLVLGPGSSTWSAHPTTPTTEFNNPPFQMAAILKKPRTLAEIEQELLRENGTPPLQKSVKNAVLMLEDLERELLSSVQHRVDISTVEGPPVSSNRTATRILTAPSLNANAARGFESLGSPPPKNWQNKKKPAQYQQSQRQQQQPGIKWTNNNLSTHCYPNSASNPQRTLCYTPTIFETQRPIIMAHGYDPYQGLLMTKSDKQRLRNILIWQLQSDHPDTTEYYSLMRKAKSLAPGLELHRILVKLYPRSDNETRVQQKRQYEPSYFENCLGQLHSVSSVTPRRMMDNFVLRVTESCSPPSRSGAYHQRHLLLEIEKLYAKLLVMEEFHIRTNILCIAEDEKNEIRRRSNETAEIVTRALTKSECRLLQILSIPKGKSLLCRVLPFLDATVRYKMLGYLLHNFPKWAGDDKIDKIVFPYLRQCILNAQEIGSLLTLIGIGGATMYNNQEMFEGLAAFKLGVTLLMCIFHQAEHILMTKCDPELLPDIEILWIRHSMAGFSALIQNYQRLPTPMEYFPTMQNHLRRFPFHENETKILQSLLHRWKLNTGGGVF